jgi:integrase/recombinase XerD
LGPEAKRRLKLRNLPNEELLRLYDSELVLRIHNVKNLSDTRKILNRFRTTLGQYPPSAELAKSFIAQYANRQPRTLYRYAQMIKAFMKWYGEPISDLKVKIPKSIPRYTEDEEIEKVRKAIEDKQSHKGCIARDLLLYDLARTSGLRRAELANLEAKDIHADFLEVRKGKGGKDRTVPLTPTLAVRLQNFIVENNLNG